MLVHEAQAFALPRGQELDRVFGDDRALWHGGSKLSAISGFRLLCRASQARFERGSSTGVHVIRVALSGSARTQVLACA